MLETSGLPAFCPPGRAHPRVAFAAPLPDRVAAERELADIVLTELEPSWRVRAALTDRLPPGWRLVDLYDVWLGTPAIAGQVVAAVYLIELGDVDPVAIRAGAAALVSAESLPRERIKGGTTVTYDLRPLLAAVDVVEGGPPLAVRITTRMDPELGTGRPDEVVAALGAATGLVLVSGAILRERLILAGEP